MPEQSRLTGAVSLMAAQAVLLTLGYATHLWIGRVLGPGSYGIYGVVLSIQTILGLLLAQGVPVAIARFVAQDREHARSILWQSLKIQVVVAVLISLATILASSSIARFLRDVELTRIIQFVSLIFLMQAIYPVYVQFLSGLHRFYKQAAITVIYAVAKLAGAMWLINYFGVYGALAGFGIGGIVAALAGWYWTKTIGGRARRPLPIKSFLSFAGIYVLILFGVQMLISLDLFMVKALIGDNVQAGYYNAAVTLSRISFLLLQSVSFVLLPSVSALTKPDASHEKAVSFIKETIRYLIILIVPSAALAAATSENLILLFFSATYLPGAPALTILMVGLGALAFYLLLVNIVAGAGRGRDGLLVTVGLLVMSAALGSILIPRYGISGAAWQTTLTGITGLVIMAAYTLRVFRINIPVDSIVKVVMATAVSVYPTYWWKVGAWWLPLQYVVLLGLYIIVLELLGEIKDKDWILVSSLHPKLKWLVKK